MASNRYKEIKGGGPALKEVGAAWTDRHPGYPSHGLTPERLASIFRESDAGDVRRQAELFEEMLEKDAHLFSVIQTRKLAVAGLDWEIIPASENEDDMRIAAFLREAIGRIENFEEALIDLLDAVGKGYSVSEIIWEISDGKALINELRWRHQKQFAFINPPYSPLNSRGDKKGVADRPRLITDASPVYGEELVPDKFVVHTYRARSGFAPRAGVLRPCAYMYLFKNYTLKDWVMFGERFAMPLRVGKFSPASTDEDRRALRNAVFNLGSDAAAVISDSTVIEFLEQSGKADSGALYERLCAFCDRAMSKAVLGQTLTTEQTGGTYASAMVHQTVRRDLLEADSAALSKTITMQLIKPLVKFNFGPNRRLPALKFQFEEDEDMEKRARTLKTLKEMGVEIPASFIYRKFGIPEPEKKI